MDICNHCRAECEPHERYITRTMGGIIRHWHDEPLRKCWDIVLINFPTFLREPHRVHEREIV